MRARARRWRLRRAALALRSGGVVAYPTEAVYGLGCDPWREDAVLRVLALKDRPMALGLIIIAAELEQLEDLVELPRDANVRARVVEGWPGHRTWLLAARPMAPAWLSGMHDCIAARVTAHPQAAALCREFGGPIVSTSANKSGRAPALTALSLRRGFPGGGVDYILPGRVGGHERASEIRDARTNRVVRAG